MKKVILSSFYLALLSIVACKKSNDNSITQSTPVTEQQVLNDFTSVLCNPDYLALEAKAGALNSAVLALNSNITEANLTAAQNAWRAVRVPWEQSEGFLIGPVEDFNYDPATDSWPVNTAELDSLLASSNPLLLENVDSLQYSLKGYHPLEYLLFGVGGTRTTSQLNARDLQYMISLAKSLSNTTMELRKSWDPNETGNYTEQIITAGSGSVRFVDRKSCFLEIVNAMVHICNEVANSKMEVPFAEHDSEKAESQYAHNATLDFKNNIVGVQNVYLCKWQSTTGHSLHDLVSVKDASLDGAIQSQINSAIEAIAAIDPNYGQAIFTQQGQIQSAQSIINNLIGTLNLLKNFIQTNITD